MVKHKFFEEKMSYYAQKINELGPEIFLNHYTERMITQTIADFASIGIDAEGMMDVLGFMYTDKRDRFSSGINSIITKSNEKVSENGFLGIAYLLARNDIPESIKENIQEIYNENPKHPYKFILSHARVFGLLNENETPNEKSLENFKEVLELEVAKVKELKEINKEYGNKNTEIVIGYIAGAIKLQGFETKEDYIDAIKNTCSQLKDIFSSEDKSTKKETLNEVENFRRDSMLTLKSDFTRDFIEKIDELHRGAFQVAMEF